MRAKSSLVEVCKPAWSFVNQSVCTVNKIISVDITLLCYVAGDGNKNYILWTYRLFFVQGTYLRVPLLPGRLAELLLRGGVPL